MKNKKGKIITITSCKGGVGKSILTMSLAGIYNLMKLKVLIIDLDLYSGSLSTYVNSDNDKTIFNLIDDFTYNRYKNIENYIYNINEYIDLIAAPKDPRQSYKIDSKYIPLLLSNVVYKYDIILIDTDHTLNDIKLTVLDNCDARLYVFTNDIFDLKNTKSFFSVAKDIGMSNVYTVLNNSTTPYKEYFSMYDIKNIIKTNVDFVIPNTMYIKNIEKYIMDSKIIPLNKKLISKKDLALLESIATTLQETKEAK